MSLHKTGIMVMGCEVWIEVPDHPEGKWNDAAERVARGCARALRTVIEYHTPMRNIFDPLNQGWKANEATPRPDPTTGSDR